MVSRPDDVGQSLGLPDFVDLTDVVEASFDASQTWGEERAAAPPAPTGEGSVRSFEGSRSRSDTGTTSGNGRVSANATRSGNGRGGRSGAPSWGRSEGWPGAGGGRSTGGSARQKKPKKQLTWAEKAERKEKRAQARREAEAAEREKDPIGFAREIVLTQLTAMPRSRAQLATKLREKEVDEDVIDAVLDRMEDVGLVDDQAYAEMLVRTRVASRGLARRALRQELVRKGIDDDTASIALEQVDDDSEREQALALARKKTASMSRLDEQTQTRRLAGLLARKGYGSSLVWSVIRQVQEEQG